MTVYDLLLDDLSPVPPPLPWPIWLTIGTIIVHTSSREGRVTRVSFTLDGKATVHFLCGGFDYAYPLERFLSEWSPRTAYDHVESGVDCG